MIASTNGRRNHSASSSSAQPVAKPPSIAEVLALKHLLAPVLSIIFLLVETKIPAVRWKSVIEGELFDDDELRNIHARFNGRLNPGIATGRFCAGGLVVMDLDNAAAVRWAEANVPPTPMKTISRRGESEHWWYRIPGGADAPRVPNMADCLGSKKRWEWEAKEKLGLVVVAKQARGQSAADFARAQKDAEAARKEAEDKLEMGPVIDVRGDGGQVVAPGAIHPSGRVYAMDVPWTQEMVNGLPFFDAGWFRGQKWRKPGAGGPVSVDALKAKRVEERIEAARAATTPDEALKRAAAWIEKADPAVSGSNGHNQTFYVACRLVCGFMLDVDTAYHLMKSQWNDSCQPPWSEEELAHKVVDAERQRGQNDGYMLVDRPEYRARRKVIEIKEYIPSLIDFEDDEFFAERAERDAEGAARRSGSVDDSGDADGSAGAGGDGATPPNGGGGGSNAGASGPMSDDDRALQKRWATPFGVDYMKDIDGNPLSVGHADNKNGAWVIPPTTNNVATVLEYSRHFSDAIRRNELKMVVEVGSRAWSDALVLQVKRKIDAMWGLDVVEKRIRDALMQVANTNAYEPAQDWLRSLPAWDGVDRFPELVADVLQTVSPKPVHNAMMQHTVVGLVARIMRPGCKVDHITFLVGPQGAGKSKFWRLLIDGHLEGGKWFSDAPLDLKSKDGRQIIGSNLLIEWGEGEHAKNGRAIDAVKAFLSTQEDEFRPPYGYVPIRRPRRCVFVGTSNDDELLHDVTGSRRFYILKTCGVIDLDRLLAMREQLFAHALDLYLRHQNAAPGSVAWHATRWWFTKPEDLDRHRAVQDFEARSVHYDDIDNWLQERVKATEPRFTVGDVIDALGFSKDKKTKRLEAEVSATLSQLGARRRGGPNGRETVNGRRGRYWEPPSAGGPDDDLPL